MSSVWDLDFLDRLSDQRQSGSAPGHGGQPGQLGQSIVFFSTTLYEVVCDLFRDLPQSVSPC